jgi:hypothetical protein
LSLQFSPHSPLSDEKFTELQALIGTEPVLPNAPLPSIESYKVNLQAAHDLLKEAYEFTDQNVGAW